MNLVVITGSAHKHGTSACLADQFIAGAREAGHRVFRFDAAFQKVHPCIACERCHKTDQGCAFADDMAALNPHLLEADLVAFVSPIYYYGLNAQIKTVIDRFYANNDALMGGRRSVLLLTCGDDTPESAEGAVASYHGMTRYLGWEDAGVLVALGCYTPEDLQKTDYPGKARELGRRLG